MRRKKRERLQTKQKRRLLTRHHFIPRSRGGTDDWWNWEYKPDEKHRAWHQLFINMLPTEVAKRLEEWTLAGRRLSEKESLSWNILFGNVSCKEAIKVVKKEWTGPEWETPAYLASFQASRAGYPVRIDCLNSVGRIITGEARWSKSWVRASRLVAEGVMKQLLLETKVPPEKIDSTKSGGESILDLQLRTVQNLFIGGIGNDRFEMVVPIEIRYDGYYLSKLNEAAKSGDGIVRFLDFAHLFSRIIRPLLAAIIFEELRTGDKIIFAIDENNQAGIWRARRPEEEKIIKIQP